MHCREIDVHWELLQLCGEAAVGCFSVSLTFPFLVESGTLDELKCQVTGSLTYLSETTLGLLK